MYRNCPSRLGPAVHVTYNNAVGLTFVNRLQPGPAYVVAFSPLPGITLLADPCGPTDSIEVRILWPRVRDEDAELILPMLTALYGEVVGLAALECYDSDHPLRRDRRRLRAKLHRLLVLLDAMERDQDADSYRAIWFREAELLARRIDPRIPLAPSLVRWGGWERETGWEYAEKYVDVSEFTQLEKGVQPFEPEPALLADARQYLRDEAANALKYWCQTTVADTDRPGDPAAEAVAEAHLALRLERLGETDLARLNWMEAERNWREFGDHRRADLAAGHAGGEPAEPPAEPFLGELLSLIHGTPYAYGFPSCPALPQPA